MSLSRRVMLAAGLMLATRALVLVVGFLPMGAAGSSRIEPRLAALVWVLAAIGLVIGMMRTSRAGRWNDAAPAGFAGGVAASRRGRPVGLDQERRVAAGPMVHVTRRGHRPVALAGVGIALPSWLVLPARSAPRTPEPTP